MENLLKIIGLLLVVLIYSCSFKSSKNGYRLEKPPVFKKGTFWKITSRQLMTSSGKKIDHSVTQSCYIGNETYYKGLKVYEATLLNHDENKIMKIFIDKANLKMIDAVGIWNNYNDTMTL